MTRQVTRIKGRENRVRRIRMSLKAASAALPRLIVYRSNKYMSAQLIDNKDGKTLLTVHEKEIKDIKGKKIQKTERAKLVGELLGKKAIELKIKTAVFDRNGYKYHGRVKALAEAVRSTGIKI